MKNSLSFPWGSRLKEYARIRYASDWQLLGFFVNAVLRGKANSIRDGFLKEAKAIGNDEMFVKVEGVLDDLDWEIMRSGCLDRITPLTEDEVVKHLK